MKVLLDTYFLNSSFNVFGRVLLIFIACLFTMLEYWKNKGQGRAKNYFYYCFKLLHQTFFHCKPKHKQRKCKLTARKNASIIFSSSLFVLQFHNQPNKNVNMIKFTINRFLIMLITKHFLTHFQIKLSSARFMQKSQYLNFIIVFPFLILFFNKTTLKRNHQ